MCEVGACLLRHPVRVSTGVPPSGVVTFLFTDVEGSTRRWEKDPDAMRVALAAHDEVLRNAIEAHGGFMFKHTGDGVCAAFSSPRAAVDAAIAAQRKLELPVRMGLATGEAELRDGDYFGAVLNRAARVMAAGHGGQILLKVRANATKFGRPRKVDDSEHITTAKRMKAGGHTGKDIAKYLGVSRATLYRYLGDNNAA